MLDRKYEDELVRHHLMFEDLLLKATDNLLQSLAAGNKNLIPEINKLWFENTQASPVLSSKNNRFFVEKSNLQREVYMNKISVLYRVFSTQDLESQIQAIARLNTGLDRENLSVFIKETSPSILKLVILSSPEAVRILSVNDKEERVGKLYNELSNPGCDAYKVYYDLIIEDLNMRKNSLSKGSG